MTDVSESTGDLPPQPNKSWLERPWGRAIHAVCSLSCLAMAYVLARSVVSPSTAGPAGDALSLVATIAMVVIGFDGVKEVRYGRDRHQRK